jgi:hypothetical protein
MDSGLVLFVVLRPWLPYGATWAFVFVCVRVTSLCLKNPSAGLSVMTVGLLFYACFHSAYLCWGFFRAWCWGNAAHVEVPESPESKHCIWLVEIPSHLKCNDRTWFSGADKQEIFIFIWSVRPLPNWVTWKNIQICWAMEFILNACGE